MKNLFLLFFMIAGLMYSAEMSAQVQTPAPSPQSQLTQKVGLTDVTITYSRPSVKGRKIFGELVPYGKVWRTGANAATTIEFSNDVKVMGKELKAGKYSLYTIPGESKWTVMFNSNWKQWGGTEYDDDISLVTVDVTSYKVQPAVESFTIGIDDLRNGDATIEIKWANTGIKVPFSVPTDEAVTASIKKTLAGPSPRDYYAAASYYLAEKKDMKQALNWVTKSIDDANPAYYQVYTKAVILKELGMNNEAKEAFLQSKKLAENAGDDHYIRMNNNMLEELGSK